MFSRMLFAVDDDEALAAALPVVSAYANEWRASVRVLHVRRLDPTAPNGVSRRLVTEVVERLAAEGVAAEGEVRLARHEEDVIEEIVSAARGAGADLVAIGSHGRSDLAALLLGGVSQRVVAALDVPVLVIRQGAMAHARPSRVLVAAADSPDSDRAVTEAAAIAAAFGADVRVLHVQECVSAQGAAWVEPEVEARAVVERSLDEVRAWGVVAAGESIVDHWVPGAIVLAADRLGADLVVLGSRRPSPAGGLLHRSVAHEVIHRSRRPVLLASRAPAAEVVR